MICEQCSRDNPSGYLYCSICGYGLEIKSKRNRICLYCGSLFKVGQNTCESCGAGYVYPVPDFGKVPLAECEGCHKKIPQGSRHCPVCGQIQQYVIDNENRREKSKWKKILVAVIILTVWLPIFLLIGFSCIIASVGAHF